MIGFIAGLLTVLIIVGGGFILDSVFSTKERVRSTRDEVNRTHMRAMQATQRIHALTWQARQALLDEARRSQDNR